MTRLLQDVRYGLRSFAKAPGFTAVAVLVLALGIGANSAIYTIVDALLLRPLDGQAGEIVGLFAFDRSRTDSYRSLSYPNYTDIREHSGVFDGLFAQTFTMVGLPAGDTTERVFAAVVSSNYFKTLGVTLAAGRPFTAAEERPGARIAAVIVGYPRWKAAGLDRGFIGSTLRINAVDFAVIGVAPQGFTGTMAVAGPQLWLPLGMADVMMSDAFADRRKTLDDRSNHTLMVSGRVKRGTSEQMVKARLDAVAHQLAEAHPAENRDLALTTHPLSRVSMSTRPQNDGPLAAVMGLFLALSGGVLLVACLNIANMVLARGTTRRKEIALRLALGAGRKRLVRQFLTEGVMLAAAGGAVGLVVGYASIRALSASLMAALPLALEFDPRPDVRVIAATAVFALGSTVLFALGPALKLSRRDLVADLKDAGHDRGKRTRWFGSRNVLVAAQVAVSLALLTGGGLFARAALRATSATPGFEYDRLVLATIDPGLLSYDETRGAAVQRLALARLRALPGVAAVGTASTVPFGDFQDGHRVERIGGSNGEPPMATYRIVGADYFTALGLRVVRGRDFTSAEESSAAAPRVAIIDALLARELFGAADALGQQVRIAARDGGTPGDPMQIVGIAPPMREEVTDPGPVPHLYVPTGSNYRSTMHLHVRAAQAGGEELLIDAMRRELRAVDARLPVLDLRSMRAFHQRSLGLWMLRAGGMIFTLLGVLALALAVVGVYGVRSYVVAQRTREFGIRMALGADASSVRALVLREGLMVCAAGLLLGLPLALLVAQAMGAVLHRIGGLDAVVFAAAPLVLAAAALVASYIPAHRATAIAPLDALRES
jgi:predicted permease